MKTRELTERITFLVQASGQDALGQPNGAWAPAADTPMVWAKVAGVSSRDIAAAAGHQATVDAKWIVRQRADVAATWRVRWRGADYAIVGEPAALAGSVGWLEIRGRKLAAGA